MGIPNFLPTDNLVHVPRVTAILQYRWLYSSGLIHLVWLQIIAEGSVRPVLGATLAKIPQLELPI